MAKIERQGLHGSSNMSSNDPCNPRRSIFAIKTPPDSYLFSADESLLPYIHHSHFQ